MKKFVLVLTVFAFVLASCTGDDNNNVVAVDTNPATASITGRWFQHKVRNIGQTEWIDELNPGGGCDRPCIEFFAGGVYKEHTYENFMGACLKSVDQSQYTRDGKYLTLGSLNGRFKESEIISIDNETLHQKITITEESSGSVWQYESLVTRN